MQELRKEEEWLIERGKEVSNKEGNGGEKMKGKKLECRR